MVQLNLLWRPNTYEYGTGIVPNKGEGWLTFSAEGEVRLHVHRPVLSLAWRGTSGPPGTAHLHPNGSTAIRRAAGGDCCPACRPAFVAEGLLCWGFACAVWEQEALPAAVCGG